MQIVFYIMFAGYIISGLFWLGGLLRWFSTKEVDLMIWALVFMLGFNTIILLLDSGGMIYEL